MSGDAHFYVRIEKSPTDVITKLVTVKKSDTRNNVTIDDLVDDINNALRTATDINNPQQVANLRGDVVVGQFGGNLIFTTTAVGVGVRLHVFAEPTDENNETSFATE